MRRVGPTLLFILAATATWPQIPERSVSRDESEIKDVFLAYIVGIMLEDHELDVDGPTLLDVFPEFEGSSLDFPFHDIERVHRTSSREGTMISVDFVRPLSFPVPVDILGYHPGRIYTTRRIVFDESAVSAHGELSHVRLLVRREGEIGIDFVRWLDLLLGSLLSDVDARVLAVAELNGRWYAILGGDTPDGGSIVGVLDLLRNRILLRPPRALRDFALEALESP